MDTALLDVLGVTVVEVPGLAVDVAFVDNLGVGLIKAGLSGPERRRAREWLLSEVGHSLAS